MPPLTPLGLFQAFLWLSPGLTLVLVPIFLTRLLLWWGDRREATADTPKPRLWTPMTIVLTLLVTICVGWTWFMIYEGRQISRRAELVSFYHESRSQFVLPEDHQHGELTFPQGSLVNRYDAHDSGEPQRPVSLRGLDAVRFSRPVLVAGVWASAMNGDLVELDRDQRISPVYRDAPRTSKSAGGWVIDRSRPYIDCKKGQLLRFYRPMQSVEEFRKIPWNAPTPDGPAAYFKPSEWKAQECVSDQGPIKLQPAFNKPPPDGAQTQVWGPLLPKNND